MPNTCSITINRGRNKGKVCKDVNKTCRHQNMQCENCGEIFSYKHTHSAHMKLCAPHKRKTTVVKKYDDDEDMSQPAIIERLKKLEHQNQVLKNQVQQVADQPRSIHNIMVIGNDFFQELIAKIGKQRAIEFLSSTASAGKPIDVIGKLYLEGKEPNNYPIACRDEDHFRYLSHDDKGGRKVVDDRGGVIIGDIMMNRLQNAFLMAANELITNHVDGGIESDRDVLRSVQNVATINKNTLVYQLAEVTTNANHPFFLDQSECEQATSSTNIQL
jgi:hypothetical protein